MRFDPVAQRDSLSSSLAEALGRRQPLIARLQAEHTDAYRLFHGSVEGRPGLTVDRYGNYLLAMVFWDPLTARELACLHSLAQELQLQLIVWERQEKGRSLVRHRDESPSVPTLAQGEGWSLEAICHEQGQSFAIAPYSHGKDPYLFLDFRAGRRWLRREVKADQTVLNLFSYTCGAGVAAAANGGQVVNVDFSRWCLEIGRQNGNLNGIAKSRFQTWQEDVFPILRQVSGLGVKGRAAQRRYLKVPQQRFDVIVLDPPTVASSPFGKVDLRCDYASMFKPCLLALNEGGRILATNHHAEVSWDAWERSLKRTATKIGLPEPQVERLLPEEDFPSFDGEQPLKMAVVSPV